MPKTICHPIHEKSFLPLAIFLVGKRFSPTASETSLLLAAVACTELLGMVMRLRVTKEITGKSSDLREVGDISSGLDR